MKKSCLKLNRPAVSVAMAAAALISIAGLAHGEDMMKYNARPGSKVIIAGTSTIHDWTMEGGIIGGHMEVAAGVTLDPAQASVAGVKDGKLPAKVTVSIPVRSLKSAHTGMDEVMQDAMHAKDHPKIDYELDEMTLKEPHAAGTPLQFDTKGRLIVNGTTNAIAMTVSIEASEKGRLKISGSTPVKMTDYGVKPPAPSIGLGLIKTGDEIKISFEWQVGAAPAK